MKRYHLWGETDIPRIALPGARAALEFIDALEQALGAIERYPAIGSTRYATELDLPGLRCWQFKGHSHLVFFIEREHHLDV